MHVIDLALKLVNPILKPGEVFPNINGIHLVIASELRDQRVVGVESTLHHPLALEDLLLHCFEPRLHASGLLRPLNVTDVQHPLAHLDRLRVFQHFREVGIDDLLEDLVLRSVWGSHDDLDLLQKQARNENRGDLHDTRVRPFGRIYNEFFPTKSSTPQENGVREAHEVPTSPLAATRG